jgi:hypothetical protein
VDDKEPDGYLIAYFDADGQYISLLELNEKSPLVVYLFTFCSAQLAAPPDWLAQRAAHYNLESTAGDFTGFIRKSWSKTKQQFGSTLISYVLSTTCFPQRSRTYRLL